MTTLVWRDGILAADTAVTEYENSRKNAQPSGRSYMQKLTVVSPDPYWRVAMATRGSSINGSLIERAIECNLAAHLEDGHDVFTREDYDCWSASVPKEELDNPEDDEQGGFVVAHDLRIPGKWYAWWFDDCRLIKRIRPGEWMALGSDSSVAHGALQCGADAVKAVWAACKFGAYTGGPVHYVKASGMILNVSRIAPWDYPGSTVKAPEASLGVNG